MIKFAVCCVCALVPAHTRSALKLVDDGNVKIYQSETQKNKLIRELSKLPNSLRVRKIINGVREEDKYSYLFILNDDGSIVKIWDLLKGVIVE